MEKLKSNLQNMALSLTLIALIAAGILGTVYALTKGPIAQAEFKKQGDAINLVLPENDGYEAYKVAVEINGAPDSLCVYKALKDNQVVGYAVETYDPKGFNGEIRYMIGFDAEGNINDYSILKQGETPGLGAKMTDWFKAGNKGAIKGLNPARDVMLVNKDKTEDGRLGQVNAITAATISSRAFVRALNVAYQAAFNNVTPDAQSGATTTAPADDNGDETAMTETENIQPEKE